MSSISLSDTVSVLRRSDQDHSQQAKLSYASYPESAEALCALHITEHYNVSSEAREGGGAEGGNVG